MILVRVENLLKVETQLNQKTPIVSYVMPPLERFVRIRHNVQSLPLVYNVTGETYLQVLLRQSTTPILRRKLKPFP